MEFRTMFLAETTGVRKAANRFVFDGENYFDIIEGEEFTIQQLNKKGYYVSEDEAELEVENIEWDDEE